jgi:hypothetical protein
VNENVTSKVFIFLVAGIALLTNSVGEAQDSGSRPVAYQACAGSEPYPCARTDVAPQPILTPPVSLGPTGNVGEPFVEPDFGEQIVRVTDANTEAPSFGCCSAADTGERTEWGLYDASLFSGDGGYRFYVIDSGGGYLFYEINAVTMAIQQILHSTNPHGLGTTNKSNNWNAGSWSTVSPTVIYGWNVSNPAQLVRYDFAADLFSSATGTSTSVTPYIDLSTCPNLPGPIQGGYGTSYSARVSDTYFGAAVGGNSQGQGIYEFVAYKPALNQTYQACYWLNTADGTTGGSDMLPTLIADGVGQLPAPAAPKLLASSGGTVSYCVVVTGNTQLNTQTQLGTGGETVPSPEACTTGSSGATLTVEFAEPFSNPQEMYVMPMSSACISQDTPPCTPYHVYLASDPVSASGKETLQDYGLYVSGPSFSLAASAIKTGTSKPPTTPGAGFNLHAGWLSRNGLWALPGYQQGYTIWFWVPGTTTMYTCLADGTMECGGHVDLGYVTFLNAAGVLEIQARSYEDPTLFHTLENPVPTGPGTDSHLSWSNDNPEDTNPVEQVFYNSVGVFGDGLLNLNLNPCTAPAAAWQDEVLMAANDGTGRVWRFAHHRGGQCANPKANSMTFGQIPIGDVSQDGKFVIFHSDWGWVLGTAYYPAWQAEHAYGAGAIVFDGTNYEFTAKGGTSGAAVPSWPKESGETVTDGTVSWTMNTGCTDANNPSNGEACRTDVFIVQLK